MAAGGLGTDIAARPRLFPVRAGEHPLTQRVLPRFAALVYPFVKLLVVTALERKQQGSPE